jgi:hypothetical protein
MNPSVLTGREFNGYLRIRIPHELDNKVRQLVQSFRAASAQARGELISALSPRAASVLSAFGERMAAVAVRTRSPEHLRLGLVGMGLADARLEDPRMNLRILAAVNHSAEEIGTSLVELLNEVASDLPPEALKTFLLFTQRSDRDKSLSAMGLGTWGSGEDFQYVSAAAG